jgi:hypothetical protein
MVTDRAIPRHHELCRVAVDLLGARGRLLLARHAGARAGWASRLAPGGEARGGSRGQRADMEGGSGMDSGAGREGVTAGGVGGREWLATGASSGGRRRPGVG